jgi:hypothetical protein
VAPRGGIGEVDRHLGVLDPARRTGVLALHADRAAALLQVARLIHHQHRAGIAQVLHHIAPQIIADPIGVPARCGQEMLHPVRGAITGMLGDAPAVLARQVSQQPQHERPGPPAWLHPGKPATDPAHQLVQHPRPPGRVYAVACGHRKVLLSRHKPG